MTVYIVTMNGKVQAVFNEREQAALYCAVRNDVEYELRIDEWDTEAIRITSSRPLFYRWSVCIDADDKVITEPACCCTFKNENKVTKDGFGWIVTISTEKVLTDDQAIDIALDRLEAWKNG